MKVDINNGSDFVKIRKEVGNKVCLEIVRGESQFPVWVDMSRADAESLADNINGFLKKREASKNGKCKG
jgi:C-terminal processing protease CtpA/Prc